MVAWSQISTYAVDIVSGVNTQLSVHVSTIALATVSAVLTGYLLTRSSKSSDLPGPIPIPVLGSIPGIVWHGGIEPYMDAMRAKYGDVST